MSVVGFLLSASLVLLVGALALSLVRLIWGPTALDRAVALDVFAAGVVAIISVLIVLEGRYDLAALLIVFVLTAFFSTVSVARFVGVGRWSDPRRKVTPTSGVNPALPDPEVATEPQSFEHTKGPNEAEGPEEAEKLAKQKRAETK